MKKWGIDHQRYLTAAGIKGRFSDQTIFAVLLLLLWFLVFLWKG
jgi:hypothetical protein